MSEKHNYVVIGLKEEDETTEGDDCTFGVVLLDNPQYEGKVFVYEGLTVTESDEGPMVSTGMVLLEPGGARLSRAEMTAEDEQIMIEVIKQISNEIIGAEEPV